MNKKDENLERIATVTTKEDLHNALKNKFGTIIIEGSLYEEIDKKITKDSIKLLASIGGFLASSIMVFIPFLEVPGSVLMFSSLAALLTAGDGRKMAHYLTRDNLCTENRLYLMHNKVVDKVRQRYKGTTDGYPKDITELDDMLAMDVTTIHISGDLYREILKNMNENNLKKFKESNKFNTSYVKHEVNIDGVTGIELTRIK